MKRYIGTVTRGVRTPIVKTGDNLVDIVTQSIIDAVESENIQMRNKDIVCVTESLLARAQGNYVTIDHIAQDIDEKFSEEIGLVFPILSRNRFAVLLKGIAASGRKVHILFSYPSDEVGNHLMDEKLLYDLGINPYSDVLEESDYRRHFGEHVAHQFTGIDYVSLYKDIAPNCEIHFSNNPKSILKYTKDVLVCSTHTRHKIKQELKDNGANVVLGLEDIMNQPIDNSGYNPEYGLLGSNTAGDDKVKLFPREGQAFVDALQNELQTYSGKEIEVMIYGDGAFKDPVGKIWELADPVVSPAYTSGLEGTPNEIKIKYVADTELQDLTSEEMEAALLNRINNKENNLTGKNETLGTTPRQLTDLLGSLADLTSGSGDKGTPVVFIQGYFDNYASI